MTKRRTAPAGLSVGARKWWQRLREEFDIADSAGELCEHSRTEFSDLIEQHYRAM